MREQIPGFEKRLFNWLISTLIYIFSKFLRRSEYPLFFPLFIHPNLIFHQSVPLSMKDKFKSWINPICQKETKHWMPVVVFIRKENKSVRPDDAYKWRRFMRGRGAGRSNALVSKDCAFQTPKNLTSPPREALNDWSESPGLLGNNERPTNPPTNRRQTDRWAQRKVSLSITR